jgi:hypothetical protein
MRVCPFLRPLNLAAFVVIWVFTLWAYALTPVPAAASSCCENLDTGSCDGDDCVINVIGESLEYRPFLAIPCGFPNYWRYYYEVEVCNVELAHQCMKVPEGTCFRTECVTCNRTVIPNGCTGQPPDPGGFLVAEYWFCCDGQPDQHWVWCP